MLVVVVIIGAGLGLLALALFWPGTRNPYSGDSNNPFFIGDSLPKRKRRGSGGNSDTMSSGSDQGFSG